MADGRWSRFAKVVKYHRNRTDLSQPALARAVHVGDSTIAAYETGRRSPNRSTAEAIDEALSAGGAIIQVWDELTDEREIPEGWRDFEKVEQQAVEVREYQISLVPGLLQTAEYTRAILRNGRMWGESRIENLVKQRTGRLEGVKDAALTFVLDETVLRRMPSSPEVMRGQLDHILGLVEGRRIGLSVFPLGSPMYPGLPGSFRIMTLTDGRVMGQEEHLSGIVVITAPKVNALVTVFGNLQAEAMGTRESADLVATIREEL
jgi:DNA-binding XRE family transcriptional regulator